MSYKSAFRGHFRFRQVWKNEGEVDVVYLNPALAKPEWIGEVKWSDRVQRYRTSETKSVQVLLGKHSSIKTAFFTSKTISEDTQLCGKPLSIQPTALYCYKVGRNITTKLHYFLPLIAEDEADETDDDESADAQIDA